MIGRKLSKHLNTQSSFILLVMKISTMTKALKELLLNTLKNILKSIVVLIIVGATIWFGAML